MKVAFVTYDTAHDAGGVSSWMRRTLPLLQAAGVEVEVHIITLLGRPGLNCAFYKERGIPIRWTPSQNHLPYGVRSCLKLLEESQPDVYVPNCIVPAYFAAGYARRSGISTIGVLHSDDPVYWGVVDEFINGRPEFRLSAVVPVSSFIESEVTSMAAAQGVTVCRIGYGVPIPEGSAALPQSTFRVIYVGRLEEEQKRISDVVSALCGVARRIPNLEAWIVGEGRARNEVVRLIQQNEMGARVQFLGWINNANIYEVLVQCHALILLSDYEGLPISMLEAMAAGVVPICLDMRSGIRDVIQHGVNGLIVEDREEDFFAAVKTLERNVAKWQQISIAARETIRQHYSIKICAGQWVDLLQRLERTTIKAFSAPWRLRLPPPNPKFGYYGQYLPWHKRIGHYTRTVPPLHNLLKVIFRRR
jgi:glycosyltransferase involved in cell wall biosynthesis